MHNRYQFQWAMLMPVIILLTGLTIFPIVYTIVNGFTDYYFLASESKQYVGISNYINVVKDEVFQRAVWNTTKFMIFAVAIETIVGLAIAVLIDYVQRGKKVWRVAILLPSLLPPVTVALIWQMMLSNHNGIINHMLSWFGIDPVNFLMDINTAFYTILFIDIWQWTPFAFLLIYASLQGVSKSQYEAAKVDGANGWHMFRYVTLPNIMSGLLFVILLRTIDTFRLFDKVNILTGGGPANSTTTITQYIYREGIYNLQIGYGSAASIIMVALVLVFSVFYIKKSIGGTQHDMRH